MALFETIKDSIEHVVSGRKHTVMVAIALAFDALDLSNYPDEQDTNRQSLHFFQNRAAEFGKPAVNEADLDLFDTRKNSDQTSRVNYLNALTEDATPADQAQPSLDAIRERVEASAQSAKIVDITAYREDPTPTFPLAHAEPEAQNDNPVESIAIDDDGNMSVFPEAA